MKSRIGTIGAGVAIALAGALGAGQTAQAMVPASTQVTEMKGTAAKTQSRKSEYRAEVGGIPLVTHYPDYGMSPKEYGIRFGHGNKKGKLNKLRLAHNAKLKRRK